MLRMIVLGRSCVPRLIDQPQVLAKTSLESPARITGVADDLIHKAWKTSLLKLYHRHEPFGRICIYLLLANGL